MYGFLRACACVPSLTVADVTKNVEAIKAAVAVGREGGAQVILFPELAITGYSCADLFQQDRLLDAAWEGLQDLAPVFVEVDRSDAFSSGRHGLFTLFKKLLRSGRLDITEPSWRFLSSKGRHGRSMEKDNVWHFGKGIFQDIAITTWLYMQQERKNNPGIPVFSGSQEDFSYLLPIGLKNGIRTRLLIKLTGR